MALGRIQRVQDSVHGLMEFHGMEAVVVDLLRTTELQRLRKIRQLGLAHLVFPGAEHSRLAHSLGTAFLAVRFGRQLAEKATDIFTPSLCPDEVSIRDLAIAALCHDLGHGPLSHAFEREIVGNNFDAQEWAAALGLNLRTLPKHWHEFVTQGLLRWQDGELYKLLEQHEKGLATRIGDFLLGHYHVYYFPRLLSSDVDVDRADFIRRDTHQTGVAYGRYDLDWLISTCTLGYRNVAGQREWTVGFDRRKAVRVLEQFLIARRAMYDTVYHHKTVRCAEGMVALFLRRLRDITREGTSVQVMTPAQPLLDVIRGRAIGPDRILKLDDFALSVLIDNIADSDTPDPTVRDLALRIRSRDLFKHVPVDSEALNTFLTTPKSHEKLQEAIEPFVPGAPEYYLVQDRTNFTTLNSDDNECAALIDDNGEAVLLKNDPTFVQYRTEKHSVVRLWTVREAIDSVKACVLAGKS